MSARLKNDKQRKTVLIVDTTSNIEGESMTWVRLDDGFPNHPKIIGLSDGAFRLYITALCYSNAYLTDGIIPQITVKKLSNSRHISSLIEANLWEICGDDIKILGYDEYQFTKEKVESERRKAAERKAKSRQSRDSHGVTPSEVLLPHPIPSHTHPIPNKDITNPSDSDFNLFWSIYPRREAKGAARAAFTKALKKASVEEIIEGAKRFASDPNRQPEFTAHASTWLNQERWTDMPLPSRGGGMTRTESSVMRALEISQRFDDEDARALENEPF
jgi:hypothetical protein